MQLQNIQRYVLPSLSCLPSPKAHAYLLKKIDSFIFIHGNFWQKSPSRFCDRRCDQGFTKCIYLLYGIYNRGYMLESEDQLGYSNTYTGLRGQISRTSYN